MQTACFIAQVSMALTLQRMTTYNLVYGLNSTTQLNSTGSKLPELSE